MSCGHKCEHQTTLKSTFLVTGNEGFPTLLIPKHSLSKKGTGAAMHSQELRLCPMSSCFCWGSKGRRRGGGGEEGMLLSRCLQEEKFNLKVIAFVPLLFSQTVKVLLSHLGDCLKQSLLQVKSEMAGQADVVVFVCCYVCTHEFELKLSNTNDGQLQGSYLREGSDRQCSLGSLNLCLLTWVENKSGVIF